MTRYAERTITGVIDQMERADYAAGALVTDAGERWGFVGDASHIASALKVGDRASVRGEADLEDSFMVLRAMCGKKTPRRWRDEAVANLV